MELQNNSVNEEIGLFGNEESIIGIVAEPNGKVKKADFGILLLNAGFLHRVGPNRIYVKLARKMALKGILSFRFDFSGIGDSTVRKDNLPFEKSTCEETIQAMNYVQEKYGIKRFILFGICAGADIAYKVSKLDQRVNGLIGINGYYLSKNTNGELKSSLNLHAKERYYLKNLFSLKKWLRFLSGKSDLKTIKKLISNKLKIKKEKESIQIPESQKNEWQQLHQSDVKTCLIYSEGSATFDAYRKIHSKTLKQLSEKIEIEVFKNTDHVFTLLSSQELLMELIQNWIDRSFGESPDWIKN